MRVSLLVTSAWLILAAVVSAKSPGKKAVRALPVVAPTVGPTTPTNGAGADPSPSSNTQPETTSQASPTSTTSQPPPPPPPPSSTSTSSAVETPTTTTSSSVPPTTTSSASSTSAPSSSRPPSQSSSAPLTSFKSSGTASMPSSASVVTSTSSVLPTASTTPVPASSSGGGSNTPLIIGSVCGFIGILGIGFAYAFFSKVRKNRRKERVFGATEGEEEEGPTGMPTRPRQLNDEWDPDYKRSPSPMPTRLSPPAATRQLHDQDYYSQYTGYDHSGGYEQHPGYEQHTGYDHAGAYEAYGGAQYPQQGYGYPQQAEIPMTPYQQPSGYNNGYQQQPYH